MNRKELVKSAKKYSLMVDWKARLGREIPFLLGELKSRGIVAGRVLDAGCGPGFHAIELSKIGHTVTGLDRKTDAAVKENKNLKIVEGDFLDKKLFKKDSFDALYSLGNTAALIASQSSYLAVIKRFKEVIRPGGALVFQTLNFEKERNSWSPPRSVSTQEGEYVFLRNFTTNEKYVRPLIVALYRAGGSSKWELETSGPEDIPRISSSKMKKLLKENGFGDIRLFGSYSKNLFKPKSSVDMIWSAFRKGR